MARMDCYIVSQGKKFFVDAVDQGVEISPWQVGTANAVIKQHVAPDQHLLRGMVKCYVPGRMAGQKKYLQLLVAKRYCFTFLQKGVGFRFGVLKDAIVGCVGLYGVQYGDFCGMYVQLCFVCLFHKGIAQDVVYMAMGVEQHFYCQVIGFDKIRQLIALFGLVTPRIDDDTFFRFIGENIGIFLQGVKNESMDLKHGQK